MEFGKVKNWAERLPLIRNQNLLGTRIASPGWPGPSQTKYKHCAVSCCQVRADTQAAVVDTSGTGYSCRKFCFLCQERNMSCNPTSFYQISANTTKDAGVMAIRQYEYERIGPQARNAQICLELFGISLFFLPKQYQGPEHCKVVLTKTKAYSCYETLYSALSQLRKQAQ